jgi:hypothetical protein
MSARDSDGRALEFEPRGEGSFEVKSRGVNRFTFYYKRKIIEEPEGLPASAGLPDTAILDSGELLLDPAGVEPGRLDLAWVLPPGWSSAVPWPLLQEAHRIPSRESMGRNVVCLGGWNIFESQTRHTLLRTAVSQRIGGDGKRINSLCNRILTEAGEFVDFPDGRTLLVAFERGGDEWRTFRAADSILFFVPEGFEPDDPAEKAESEFLERLAWEIIMFHSPAPAGREGSLFLGAVSRLAALRVVAESGLRDVGWLMRRTAHYLDSARARSRDGEEAQSFAAVFFLDRALKRLAGSDKGLDAFLSGVAGENAAGIGLDFSRAMADLSAQAGFDVMPFWKRYISGSAGFSVDSELEKCGLGLDHEKEGLTLIELRSR